MPRLRVGRSATETPSGVRQFLLTAGVLGVAAVFCGVFVFAETRNLDPNIEPRKIPAPPSAAPTVVVAPATIASANAVDTTSASPKQEETKPVAPATEHVGIRAHVDAAVPSHAPRL